MINTVVLVGRLTQDPMLKVTPNTGTAVANFTLAVNRRFNKDEADFIPIVVWKQLAENCAKYLVKGSQVAVEGRLQIRSYEDREGQRRTIAEVVAENVQFLGSKQGVAGQGETRQQGGYSANGGGSAADAAEMFGGTMVGDDEVPF